MALPTNLPQYDAMRRRAQQQSRAQSDEEQDQLKRGFARTGMLNSGAYLKQQQIQSDNAMKRAAEADENIGFQEQAELQRREEVERGYQEQEKGRQFQAGESEKQRSFTKGLSDEDMKFKREVFEREDAFRNKEFEASQMANWLNGLLAIQESGLDIDDPEEMAAIEGYANKYTGQNRSLNLGGRAAPTPIAEGRGSAFGVKGALPWL